MKKLGGGSLDPHRMAGHIDTEAVIRRGLGVLRERRDEIQRQRCWGDSKQARIVVWLEFGDCVQRKEFVVRTSCNHFKIESRAML